MDFVSDTLQRGRTIRALTIVDVVGRGAGHVMSIVAATCRALDCTWRAQIDPRRSSEWRAL
jgi:hypothetical protein